MEFAMMDKETKDELIGGLIGLLLLALLLLFTSCRTQIKYVPVETIKTDSVFLNSIRVDSVIVHDSTSITFKGDSVIEYKYRYIYKYKDKVDTVYINRTDTIRVPYPVEIEKKLSAWQRAKMDIGGWAMVVVVVIILIVFGRMIYKLRK